MKVVDVKERVTQMQLLEDHLVLGECASLISQQVLDAAQLLGNRGGPHHGTLDLLVPLYHPRVERLSHVKVHAQAGRQQLKLN